MAEVEFPNQHTTTVTTTSVQTNLRYDPSYIKTFSGWLKIGQLVFNLLGFICIEASGSWYSHRGPFFIFVSTAGMCFTGILLIFYLFHVIEKLYKCPWLKIEGIFCLAWACLYMIASSFAITYGVKGFTIAAVFGFCAMTVYGCDAILKYRAIRKNELAQGERVVNKETTEDTLPKY